MNRERMEELLNQIVDYVAIARDTSEQIQILIHMGFNPDELINFFFYSADDVKQYGGYDV